MSSGISVVYVRACVCWEKLMEELVAKATAPKKVQPVTVTPFIT